MTTSTLPDPKVDKARFISWGVSGASRAGHETYAPKLEAAVATLARFEYPQEIAEFLRAEGITGAPAHAAKCPAAVWLQRTVGHDGVRVSGTISIRHANGTTTVMITPPVVYDFYKAFDAGEYSYLRKAIEGCRCWLCSAP